MCTNISFSTPYLLYEGVFALLILCSMYCRLIYRVTLPTFCNVSCPVYLWTKHTYRLAPPDTVGRSHTFHSFSILSVSTFISLKFSLKFLKIWPFNCRVHTRRWKKPIKNFSQLLMRKKNWKKLKESFQGESKICYFLVRQLFLSWTIIKFFWRGKKTVGVTE